MTDTAPEYAFEGEIRSPIAFTYTSIRQQRQAVLVYRYTPHWTYWSPSTGLLTTAPTRIEYALSVRISAAQAKAAGLGKGPIRLPVLDLQAALTAHPTMRDMIECLVDIDVRRRDGIARRANDIPGPTPDNWL
jgi:hypothetical protein